MTGSESPARCLIRRGETATELPPERFSEIDELRRATDVIIWLQLRNPGDRELRLLADEFDIHPLAMEDVRKRGQRPKVDVYQGQQMLVVYEAVRPTALAEAAEGMTFDLHELHAFGGRGWVVTVQWADSDAVDIADRHFGRTTTAVSVGSVLYTLFDGGGLVLSDPGR